MFLLTAAESGIGADTGTITTVHLALIAVLIVLVIGAIIWGARQKHARAEGERIEAERTEQVLAHPQTHTAVSPAPPPLGDAGMPAPMSVPMPVAAKPKVAKAAAPKPVAAPKEQGPAVTATKPVKPKAAPAPQPAAVQAAKPVAAKPAAATTQYGLIDVKGLGPKAVPLLAAQGVGDLAALAALSPARAAEIDTGLGVLAGRMARDRWVEQAKLLAAGDVTAFEAAYGKL